jgi:hypothetical protein
MLVSVEGKGKNQELVIRVPMSERDSKSGKTIVVASSNGNVPTTASYNGKPIIVGLNAYINKDKK